MYNRGVKKFPLVVSRVTEVIYCKSNSIYISKQYHAEVFKISDIIANFELHFHYKNFNQEFVNFMYIFKFKCYFHIYLLRTNTNITFLLFQIPSNLAQLVRPQRYIIPTDERFIPQ